jgi:hypothetical protein
MPERIALGTLRAIRAGDPSRAASHDFCANVRDFRIRHRDDCTIDGTGKVQ